MDQVVVDCRDDPVEAGDDVVVFGPGDAGEPTADDWAAACDTIAYEIVTRIGPRVPRRYVGEGTEAADGPESTHGAGDLAVGDAARVGDSGSGTDSGTDRGTDGDPGGDR
jgi:alanine racemase